MASFAAIISADKTHQSRVNSVGFDKQMSTANSLEEFGSLRFSTFISYTRRCLTFKLGSVSLCGKARGQKERERDRRVY